MAEGSGVLLLRCAWRRDGPLQSLLVRAPKEGAGMTENELKRNVLRLAYINGWSVYHVPQRTMLNGGGKGYPDLTLARDGQVMWFELKQQDALMSPEQYRWSLELPSYHCIRPRDWETG